MEGEIYELAEAVYSSSPSKEFYAATAATVAIGASEYVRRMGFEESSGAEVLEE